MTDLERECAAVDELLRVLGLDPEQCRTDGGAINMARTRTLLSERVPDDKRLLREVFAVCEASEDECHDSDDAFKRGRAFEAKRIRRSIGTWYQDTFCGRYFMGDPALSPNSDRNLRGRPLAWIRKRSDGGYEGPIADADKRMDEVRRKSGAWTPLYELDEMSPDFTDTARAALLWVLWHHQGGSSDIGQPIRFALGMGAHDRLTDYQVAQARLWGDMAGKQAGHCTEGDRCVCGGDVPAVRAGCANWVTPRARLNAGLSGFGEEREH